MCGGGPITYDQAIPFIVDGGGAVPETGIRGSFPRIPFKFLIIGWTIESPTAGNVTVGLVADPYANNSFPSTSIVAAAPPAMVGVKSKSGDVADLVGWTRAIPANYSIGLTLDVIATITLFTFSLNIRRTIGL